MKSRSLIVIAGVVGGHLFHGTAAGLLGTAESFAVLGASTVTSTGNTLIVDDLGVYPGLAITGFPPGVVAGITYSGGSIAQQAQADAASAFAALGLESPTQNLSGTDLGGLTLGPGVRSFSSSAQLTGTLTLDAGGETSARFDFQIGSTLLTATVSSINLINGASADNVFWEVGTSATLGAGTSFYGNILADQSITVASGSSLSGRALALKGAVTLDNNLITLPSTIPECGGPWSFAGVTLAVFAGRWVSARRCARLNDPGDRGFLESNGPAKNRGKSLGISPTLMLVVRGLRAWTANRRGQIGHAEGVPSSHF